MLPPRDLVDQAVNGGLAAGLLDALFVMERHVPKNLNSRAKVLGKQREAMIVSLLPKGDGRLAQG